MTTTSSRWRSASVPWRALAGPGSSGSSSVFTHPPSRMPSKAPKLCATTWDTPVASAAASRWSVPSERSRLVAAKNRSGCFKSGLPACATESPVIWCTIASGRALATASPTDTASSPSITTPSAPSCSSKPSLAGLVVVAVTWWPRATSCGTSRRPKTPVPPATNTRITITVLIPELTLRPRDETAPAVCDIGREDSRRRSLAAAVDMERSGDGAAPRRRRPPAAERRENDLARCCGGVRPDWLPRRQGLQCGGQGRGSEPVIFQNFGSKAALFAAVVERAAAEVKASLTSDGLPVREHFAEPPGADVIHEPPDRNVRRDPWM